MPKVSEQFGPIYVQVVLNGSGGGQATFQAVGSNTRITNISFNVSTTTSQAQVAIYKGQVAAGNRVFTSQSGSTGANASGNIDLFDGETCFVVWTGGDAGSTATATFVGEKIPFGERLQAADLTASDPVAAGDGSLIFNAIKSPNYVPGVSGWTINRDGSYELGSGGTIRGDFLITGTNGNYIQGTTSAGTATIFFRPRNLTGVLPANIQAGSIVTGVFDQPGVSQYLQMDINSPRQTTDTDYPRITFQSQDHITGDQMAILIGDSLSGAICIIELSGKLIFTEYGTDAGKGTVDMAGTAVSSGAITTTETTVLTSNSITFRAGRAYCVTMCSSGTMSVAANRSVSRLRKTNTAGQQLGSHGDQYSTTTQGGSTWSTIFYVSGSDVTAALAWTGLVNSGATSVTYTAAADSPRYMRIEDIGDNTKAIAAGMPQLV